MRDTLSRSPSLSRFEKYTNKRIASRSPLPLSTFLHPKNVETLKERRKRDLFLSLRAKVRAIVFVYSYIYIYRGNEKQGGDKGGWTRRGVRKSIGKTRGEDRRGRIARKNRMIKRPRHGSRVRGGRVYR